MSIRYDLSPSYQQHQQRGRPPPAAAAADGSKRRNVPKEVCDCEIENQAQMEDRELSQPHVAEDHKDRAKY